MKNKTTYRCRGSVYVLVLMTSVLVTVIGLSAMTVGRIQTRITNADQDAAKARHYAQSMIDLGLYKAMTTPGWRTTHTNDTWTADYTWGEAVVTYKFVDEEDGDLADDPTQPVRLYGKATVGDAMRLYSVVLESVQPPNLLSNADMETGTTDWIGTGPEGSCDLISDTTTVHSGTASIHTTNRSNQFAGPHQNITSKITNGATYYTEVWVKGTMVANQKRVVILMDTTNGLQSASLSVSWFGTNWYKVSGTLTPTWTGILNAAYWKVDTSTATYEHRIDDALLVEGTGPPMTPVRGTWRQEVQ